ncbi:hypothetical protein CDAR_402491 [Caerostris darwini]|uniref:Uncharacterized protein n=1 Tax=Caerostris darwini TaxID=1538125 RepID=A0AAV4S001_9ARAC|nr:hypothetical protein CDAR_402491 [Caerostris darwini]
MFMPPLQWYPMQMFEARGVIIGLPIFLLERSTMLFRSTVLQFNERGQKNIGRFRPHPFWRFGYSKYLHDKIPDLDPASCPRVLIL